MPNSDKTTLRLAKLFPSIVTLLGICSGVSAIRFALDEKWQLAVTCVVIATLLDAVDGKFARALKATSKFGSNLDSLSDFINFGFVPPLVIFLWSSFQVPKFGWASVLFFVVCCAIRLARFNSDIDAEDEKPAEWKIRFFKGVPSPAGALAALAPMMIMFAVEDKFIQKYDYFEFLENPYFLIFYLAFIAILMASRVPSYSLKKILIKKKFLSLFFIFIAGFIVSALIQPWLMIVFTGVVYYALLPISALHYLKLEKMNA
ncbi:MAG: phosphatidylcholine/phosphatidylserine synthase [Rickettsiales bacterium]|nr:phosphatidylcholine/phosphatidylserine synthase [Rickettsiales bacterium]